MAVSGKRKKLPVFKQGEQVCFLLQKGKDIFDKEWAMGEIVLLVEVKGTEWGDIMMADIVVYEAPAYSLPKDTTGIDEWESLACLPFDLPPEVILLSRLSSRTKWEGKKSSQRIVLPIKDICKATENDFRLALATCRVHVFDGKQTYRQMAD